MDHTVEQMLIQYRNFCGTTEEWHMNLQFCKPSRFWFLRTSSCVGWFWSVKTQQTLLKYTLSLGSLGPIQREMPFQTQAGIPRDDMRFPGSKAKVHHHAHCPGHCPGHCLGMTHWPPVPGDANHWDTTGSGKEPFATEPNCFMAASTNRGSSPLTHSMYTIGFQVYYSYHTIQDLMNSLPGSDGEEVVTAYLITERTIVPPLAGSQSPWRGCWHAHVLSEAWGRECTIGRLFQGYHRRASQKLESLMITATCYLASAMVWVCPAIYYKISITRKLNQSWAFWLISSWALSNTSLPGHAEELT